MKTVFALLLAWASLSALAAVAADAPRQTYALDGLRLILPAEFGAPKMEKIAADTTAATFTLPGSDASMPAMFTIVSQPSAVTLPLKEKDDYVMLTRVCASQWLAEIRLRETAWADDTQTTEIGGMPATRVHLVAPKDGTASNGFLYCVALGNRLFKIATRDAGFVPTARLNDVGHAVEAATFDGTKTKLPELTN